MLENSLSLPGNVSGTEDTRRECLAASSELLLVPTPTETDSSEELSTVSVIITCLCSGDSQGDSFKRLFIDLRGTGVAGVAGVGATFLVDASLLRVDLRGV